MDEYELEEILRRREQEEDSALRICPIFQLQGANRRRQANIPKDVKKRLRAKFTGKNSMIEADESMTSETEKKERNEYAKRKHTGRP